MENEFEGLPELVDSDDLRCSRCSRRHGNEDSNYCSDVCRKENQLEYLKFILYEDIEYKDGDAYKHRGQIGNTIEILLSDIAKLEAEIGKLKN